MPHEVNLAIYPTSAGDRTEWIQGASTDPADTENWQFVTDPVLHGHLVCSSDLFPETDLYHFGNEGSFDSILGITNVTVHFISEGAILPPVDYTHAVTLKIEGVEYESDPVTLTGGAAETLWDYPFDPSLPGSTPWTAERVLGAQFGPTALAEDSPPGFGFRCFGFYLIVTVLVEDTPPPDEGLYSFGTIVGI